MSWWQRMWQGVSRLIPGRRNRSQWEPFKEIDSTKVDDSDDWRDRNNNHI